eukprot:TRINITY_DN5943_c1_g4_i1.p1 TRINITY_DN5943_c1_g4~~TRINITY_DN5943_c1_g4_i1.p1  ORF type:complete len:411 (+),score=200.64 TRINITY_DN5943_c1_g4_i1:122-1234(+)
MEQAVDVQNAKVAKLDQDIVEAAQRLDVARAELAEQSQQHKGLERKAAVAARQGAVEIQEAAAARAAAQVAHHKKVAGLVQKVHAEEAARACAIQDYAKERSRLQETVREKEAEVAEAQKRIGDKHSAECVSAEKAVAELREEHLAELAKGDDYTRQRNEIQKQRLELDKKNCETLTQIAELRRTQDDTAAAQHTRLLELHQQARNLTCPDVVKAEADAVAALRSKKAALEREKQLLEVQTHGVALGRELQAKSAVEKAAKSASSARNAAHKKCEATFTREDKTRKQLEKLTEAHTAVEAEVAQQRTALEGLLQERDRLHAKRILEDDGEMSVVMKRARNKDGASQHRLIDTRLTPQHVRNLFNLFRTLV